jgi:hypothetical protein
MSGFSDPFDTVQFGGDPATVPPGVTPAGATRTLAIVAGTTTQYSIGSGGNILVVQTAGNLNAEVAYTSWAGGVQDLSNLFITSVASASLPGNVSLKVGVQATLFPTITPAGGGLFAYTWTTPASGYTGTNLVLAIQIIGGGGVTFSAFSSAIACFAACTEVETLAGPRAIGSIQPGDLVATIPYSRGESWEGAKDARMPSSPRTLMPVARVFSSRAPCLRLPAHALGPDLPSMEVRATAPHPIWHRGDLVEFCALPGVLAPDGAPEMVYNLQFERECAFELTSGLLAHAESPYHATTPLPLIAYTDRGLYRAEPRTRLALSPLGGARWICGGGTVFTQNEREPHLWERAAATATATASTASP